MTEMPPDRADGPATPPAESRVSRSKFLAAAGGMVVGAAAAGAPVAAAASRVKRPTRKWNRTADVVVVGSGAAAFSAALTARDKGQKVLMIEKAAAAGGTTAKSGGAYWIPNNSLMRARGLSDPKDDAMKYMIRCSYPALYDPAAPLNGIPQFEYSLIETYYDTAATAVDELSRMGSPSVLADVGLGGHADGDPDYHADFPEDKAPYGRTIRPPQGGGAGLIKQLQAAATTAGIPLLLETPAVAVFRNSKGQVVGVQATQGGKSLAIRAKRAVIFGSGGFTQNFELARNFLRGPIFGGCAVPTNTGDFVEIGIQLGAQLGNMINAFWAENPLEQTFVNSSVPNDIWIPYGDSMIYVNKYGRRVTNEKITYNERTQSHFYWDAPHREYSNLVLMMVYDSSVASDPLNWPFRYPVPLPGVQSPLVISGNSIPELAQAIDARLAKYADRTGNYRLDSSFADNLQATIGRFNGFAAAGKDDDFHRGETPIQIAWHGPARKGNTQNPTMFPFASGGPYYCILIGGGTLDTKGGPVVNTMAQVLSTKGTPIAGLYGAGNCIASPAAQAYWSAGGTIGPALTFGYIAGLNAAKEPVKAV